MQTFLYCSLVSLALLPLLAAAQSSYREVEAEVVSVEPITQTVTEKIPHRSCRDETVKVVREGGSHSATPSILGAIVGGTVGGAVSDHSHYEPLIIGAGAVLGASVGHDISHSQSARSYYTTEQRCTVDYELRDRFEVVGYRVSYRYGDTIYQTRTETHPGDSIPLQIEIRPVVR